MRTKVAPDMFANLSMYPDDAAKIAHIEEVIKAKIEDKTLYLTDLFNQPNPDAKFLIPFVVTGNSFSSGQQGIPAMGVIDHELANYQVEVEALSATILGDKNEKTKVVDSTQVQHKISYKPGTQVETGYQRKGEMEKAMRVVYPLGEDTLRGKVSMPIAWQILSQHGEHCSPATPRTQASQWHVREIRPKPQQSPRKSRGNDTEARA